MKLSTGQIAIGVAALLALGVAAIVIMNNRAKQQTQDLDLAAVAGIVAQIYGA